jgi:hypothetical protein
MYFWKLESSKLEKWINVSLGGCFGLIFWDYLHQGHIFLAAIFFLFLFWFYIYTQPKHRYIALENRFGKWILHTSMHLDELSELKLLWDSKYGMVMKASLVTTKKSRIIILFFDQFMYEDEADFRYFLKNNNQLY